MVSTFSIVKSFDENDVPTEKGADLCFTSFLDARVEKGTLLGHLWVDRFGRHGLKIKKT